MVMFSKDVYANQFLKFNLLNAVGRSDLFLKTDLSKLPIIVLAMVITLPMGVRAMVIGSFIVTALSYFINAYPSGRLFGYGAGKQLKDCFKIILSTLIMAGLSYFTMQFFMAPLIQLMVAISVASIAYLVSAYLLKVKELDELTYALRKILGKKEI